MNRYFVEFEFEASRNVYWFPIIINSESNEYAIKLKTSFEKSINDNYKLKRSTNPERIYEEINSQFINDYITQRMRGKICILNANIWKFNDIPNMPELNFSEHLDLYSETLKEYINNSITNLIAKQRFPVRQIYSESNIEDFLLINIIKPD